MSKKKTWIILTAIFLVAIFAGILDYPKYFNQGADFVNSKLKLQDLKYKIPHFWEKPFKLGLDLQGGAHLVYEADLSQMGEKDKSESMSGLRDVIERRVNLFGVKEPVVQIQNERLIVELAGIKDVNEAIKMIGETPYLEFKEQRPEEITKQILDKQKEVQGKTQEEIQKIPDWILAFDDPYFTPTRLTGQYLKSAKLGFDQTTSKPLILIEFNDEGSKLFEEITSKNVGKQIAIYIDSVPLSAPTVQEAIAGGKAQITGTFTLEGAKQLARNLNAGALPVPIKLISQQSVGPTLGKISLEHSLKAGIFGFLAVLLFMIIFYRFPGILASIALASYVILVSAIFKLIPVTLTLAGIAGFILSIGMAVDANILIFSRMREEAKQGKGFSVSVEEGFRRAWPSIRDSNLNSLIICAILFTFATSFIQGFSLTLSIGIILSMFSAVFITRLLLRIFVGTKLENIKWLW